MNRAYAESMAATVERLEAEKDDIAGVIVTSAKKTFFAGGDLNDLRAVTPEQAQELAAGLKIGKGQLRRLETLGKPVVAALNGTALGGGLEIALATHHRISVDDAEDRLRLPGGAARPAPRRRRHRAHGAHARHRAGADGPADAGPESASGQGEGARHRRRAGRDERGPDPRREGVDRGQPRGAAAVGRRQEVQDPRRHALHARARDEPAGLPGEPAQADQGRELPGAAPHHGRGGRGRAGRLRQRDRDRGALLRRPRDRPGLEEHDPGVLLRPAAGQRLARPLGGRRDVPLEEGRRARRRHDGRRDRVRVREGRHRGRAEGRLAGGRRPRQGLLGETRREGRLARQDDAGEGRRAARADHRDRRPVEGRRAPTS